MLHITLCVCVCVAHLVGFLGLQHSPRLLGLAAANELAFNCVCSCYFYCWLLVDSVCGPCRLVPLSALCALPLASCVILAGLSPAVRCLKTAGLFVQLHLATLHSHSTLINATFTGLALHSFLVAVLGLWSLVLGPWSLLLVHYRVSLSASISAAHLPARLSSNSTVLWSQPANAAGATQLPPLPQLTSAPLPPLPLRLASASFLHK